MSTYAPPRHTGSSGPPSDSGVRIVTAIITVLALAGVVFYATTTDQAESSGSGANGPQISSAPSSAATSSDSTGARTRAVAVRTGAQLRSQFPLLPGARKVEDREALGVNSRIVVYVVPGTETDIVNYYRTQLLQLGIRWSPPPPETPRKAGGNGYRARLIVGENTSGEKSLGDLNISALATIYVPKTTPGTVNVELGLDDVSGR